MRYFTYFPKILLDGRTITNIAAKCEVLDQIKNQTSAYEFYTIQDGETAELLAYQFYGNPQYDWVIWLVNDIAKPIEQWPLFADELTKYTFEKYGEANYYAHHHWETNETCPMGAGIWVMPGYEPFSEIREVLNFQYEEEVNEAKRRIKIVRPEIISLMENNLRELMRQQQEEGVPLP